MCFMCAMTQQDLPDCNAGPDTTYPGASVFAARVESGDAAAGTGTTAVMAVGDTFSGTLGFYGDRDWVRIQLEAGQSYSITLTGGSLADPYLRLYNGAGVQLAFDDDAGTGFNSAINFTASSSGTYYIAAGAYDDSGTGSYVIGATQAAPPEPLRAFTHAEIAYQLTNTFWDGQSRGFNVTESSGTITYNLTALTAAGQALARDALAIWSELSGLTFVATGGSAAITFDDSDSGAYATSTMSFTSTANADVTITSSDVNVSTFWLSSYGTSYDSYAFQTYIHEIGHALGLGHAGNYNGSASYSADADYLNDSWQATIMSYFDQNDNTYIDATRAYVVTPMIADVLAIQDLYGVAGNLRTGNTVYGYNSNAGGMYQTLFNGITSGSFAEPVTLTIVDNGGYDTLNLSGQAVRQRVDLRAGTVSDVFGHIGNLSIAHGTLIEAVISGRGNDMIIGNGANNRIWGAGGTDTLAGGGGNDYLNGGAGNDSLNGGAGNDTLEGVAGINTLVGGDGNDLLLGGAARDVMSADAGDNTLRGGGGNDHLVTGGGHDLLEGGVGNDRMIAGDGRDTLIGGTGHDALYGAGAGDDLSSVSGNNTLSGGSGHDRLIGGSGNDLMMGGDQNDWMVGGGGHDTLQGDAGRDVLFGAGGNDILVGGAGSDTLTGGAGVDRLTGGADGDRFVFTHFSDSNLGAADQITDFQRGLDRIDLSALNATWIGGAAFTNSAGQVRFTVGASDVTVLYDADGNGVADMAVVVEGLRLVGAGDFIL